MNRFLIKKINPVGNEIILDDIEQVHHLKNVLRIRPGEIVGIFDGSGNEFISSVVEVTVNEIKLAIKEKKISPEPGIKITVACAIPKNVKMDDIVDKLTQLGVKSIIPLETERVIVRLDKQKKAERKKRWEKIALSALKQSQRNEMVEIKEVSSLKEVIDWSKDFDLKLIPTLEGGRAALKKVFNSISKKIDNLIILIGPEGDFSPSEIARAKEAGFLPVGLGSGVLRVDTAAIAVVSFIKLNEA